MSQFTVFDVDLEIDCSGKELQEEIAMGNRYLESNDQLAGMADENMTDEQIALSDEQTDIYCKPHYERGIEFEQGQEHTYGHRTYSSRSLPAASTRPGHHRVSTRFVRAC